jgi:hypothetical protein
MGDRAVFDKHPEVIVDELRAQAFEEVWEGFLSPNMRVPAKRAEVIAFIEARTGAHSRRRDRGRPVPFWGVRAALLRSLPGPHLSRLAADVEHFGRSWEGSRCAPQRVSAMVPWG